MSDTTHSEISNQPMNSAKFSGVPPQLAAAAASINAVADGKSASRGSYTR
jgi:hypothetical protein